MQLRYALANSINTIAVKVAALVGVKDVLKLGYVMGLTTWEPTDANLKRVGLSLPLGGAEVRMSDMATAFGVFATGGMRMEQTAILKVVDSSGKTLFEHKPVAPRPELEPDVAFIISSILSDNDARKDVFGLRSHLVISGKTVAAKTGTTDDKRDNWTVGYSKSRVVVTWVGNNDNSPMSPTLASGITGAAPIWNRIMREAIKDIPDEPFERPDNVIEMDIDAFGGGLPFEGQPQRKEFFVRGSEPTGPAAIYQKLKISRKDSNKLANSVEVATGDYDEKLFIVLREDDPVSGDGKNRWQEGINGWIAGADSKYKAPTETYSGGDSNQVVLQVKRPGDNERIDSNSVTVEATAISTADIEKFEIYVDGNKVKEISNEKSITETITVANGSHIIKVRVVDKRGTASDRELHVGINEAYATPTPTPASP